MKKVIRNRSLLLIGAAECLTDLGNWVTILACFALIVFHSGGGAAESGGILLALLVPALPVSPVAGWLSDRYNRKRLMVASKVLAALATLGLVFAGSLEMVYAFLALQTAFSALVVAPRQASIFQVVPRDELSRANAFLQQLSSIVKIAGPLLAGALLAVMSPQAAIAVDACCLLLAGLLLTALPKLSPPQVPPLVERQLTPGTPGNPGTPGTATGQVDRSGATAGTRLLDALSGSSGLKWLFVVMMVDSAIVATFDLLGSIFTRDALRGDETLYSVLISLVGAGAVASTLFLMFAGKGRHLWRDVALGVGLFGAMPASFVIVTLWRDAQTGALAILLLGAGAMAGGIANGLFGVQSSTLLQLLSPTQLLGRMEGLFQGTAVVGQLAAFLTVPLLVPAAISLGGIFAGDAVALVLLALVMTVALRGNEKLGQVASHQERTLSASAYEIAAPSGQGTMIAFEQAETYE